MDIFSADKADKKDIKRFYKSQRYSAGFLGDDRCFLVRDTAVKNTPIIASVIVSYCSTSPFLHALVVDIKHQKQGLATALIKHCQQHFNSLVCFCEPKLASLYLANRFQVINDIKMAKSMPEQLTSRFDSYRQHTPSLLALSAKQSE
ncbi:GNAT family N-acetyltransferase [Thalassotalea crassostreae]|uniref:GNAT family N-acetyltransferase n=1 Tax=Thalassotalea crassostreae TaxID=1763536 RepID=UPI000838A093|nr:GNAT family N-acetyltransferase [Thalassotalea crassostreae]